MQFRKLRTPTSVQWEVTPNCNYRCFHCYNYWRTGGYIPGHIDYGIVVSQLIENNIFKVILTGGEPLLVFSEMKPHIETMIKAGIKVSINTNAALLTQEMAEFFKANNINLLISLPCCVPEINDKITTVEGSFDLTIAGMQLARLNDVNFSVNMVVSKLNKDYVIETAKFLYGDLGLTAINATKACRPINGASEFDDYALNLQELRQAFNDLLFVKQEYSMYVDSLTVYPECACDSLEMHRIFGKRKCYAGRTSVAIGYNGDVKACARESISYGNLNAKTLKECWDSIEDWRAVDDSKLPNDCRGCNIKNFCLGGCRVENRNEIPNKCCRDISNIPIKYETEQGKCFDYSLDDAFKIVDGLRFYEEDFGMRGINQNKEVFFITKILHSFMSQNNTFSKEDFMKEFEISSEEVNDVLSYLINSKAINTL